MAIIKTQTQENAQGSVKETYDLVLKKMPFVPKPLQLLSASPKLLQAQMQSMGYFMNHEKLSPTLLAYIRFLVALNNDYPYCIELNSSLVKQLANLTDEQLAEVRADPAKAILSEKDKALLLFALKAVSAPEDVSKNDMDELHKLGWEDIDIFDATHHGASVISAGILFNAFKMNED